MNHESQSDLLGHVRELNALLATLPEVTPWSERQAFLATQGYPPGRPRRISGLPRVHHKDALAYNERWDVVPVHLEALLIPAPGLDLSDEVEACETLEMLRDLLNGAIYMLSSNGVARTDLPAALLGLGIDLAELPVYADVVEPRSVYRVLSFDYNSLLIMGTKKGLLTKIVPLVPELKPDETRPEHIRRAHAAITGIPIEHPNAALHYLAHCCYQSARQLHARLERDLIGDGLYARLLAVLRRLAERAAGAICLSSPLLKKDEPTLMLTTYNHEGQQEHVFVLNATAAMTLEARAEELHRLLKAARPGYTGYIASRDRYLDDEENDCTQELEDDDE